MKIENTQVFGFGSAIHGMRNPKNSWHLSDSLSNTHWIDSTNHHSTANCFLNNNIEETCSNINISRNRTYEIYEADSSLGRYYNA